MGTTRNLVSPLFLRSYVALLLVWWLCLWWLGLFTASGKRWADEPPLEAYAQLRSIERRLTSEAARRMGRFFPEGRLFTHSFYGFALANMATALPKNDPFREEALRKLEWIIPKVEFVSEQPPFRGQRGQVPKGGIIAAGHANLLRAGYALLGGQQERILRTYADECRILHGAFMASNVASLGSYGAMTWPVDNCCALESLRIHDTIYGSTYSEAGLRWADWMEANLDAETGMMVAQINLRGETLERPRGCALSWSLAFMPGFAPELARKQYERYREEWFIHALGTTGVREWPPGEMGLMDADSGPVVHGIGAAASGLGIAAAKANGDWANLTGMLRGMELVAFPAWSIRGEKWYLGESVLLADILALWGKTIRVWDQPAYWELDQSWTPPANSGFWSILLAAGVFAVVFFALAAIRVFRAVRALVQSPYSLTERSKTAALFQSSLIFLWLLDPSFLWWQALLFMFAVGLWERFSLGERSTGDR